MKVQTRSMQPLGHQHLQRAVGTPVHKRSVPLKAQDLALIGIWPTACIIIVLLIFAYLLWRASLLPLRFSPLSRVLCGAWVGF